MKTTTKRIKRAYDTEANKELVCKKEVRVFLDECYKEIFELIADALPEDILQKLSELQEGQQEYNVDIMPTCSDYDVVKFLEMKDENYVSKVSRHFEKDTDDKISELECEGYRIIKSDSLAQDIRIENFIAELEANPYQLNLV